MSYQLKLDEMLDAAVDAGLLDAQDYARRVEVIGDELAKALAEKLGVMAGDASFEGAAFAGTCVAFYPIYKGQPLPEALAEYDDAEEWGMIE